MSKTIPLFFAFLILLALPTRANAQEDESADEEPELNAEEEAEYAKRVKELRTEYVKEKEEQREREKEIDLCEGIDCSFKGYCEIIEEQPYCKCEEPGYITETNTGTDCVPLSASPGWSREAAIIGLVATPVSAILGFSAFGTTVMKKHSLSMSFRIADLSIIGLLGPTIATGSFSARDSSLVSGTPLLRLPAHLLYAAGTVGGLVNTLVYAEDSNNPTWPVLLWSGAGATALLLHSIDAAVSYKQAIGVADEASDQKISRPWTWTSFIVGAAATAGAVIVGVKAREKYDVIGDLSPSEILCEGIVIDGESATCQVAEAQLEARKWAGATDMLIGLAATGLVMGGVLYFVEPLLPCPHVLQDVSLTPFASPDGAGLMFGGRF